MRIIIFSLVALVLAGGLIWGFLAGRAGSPDVVPVTSVVNHNLAVGRINAGGSGGAVFSVAFAHSTVAGLVDEDRVEG